jgi:hypothetical protein
MPIRKVLLLLGITSQFLFGTYAYQATFTINHLKVPNTDRANFPVLISGTYPQMASVANGGYLTNTNGYDLIFTADSGCSTKLSWETESYSPTGQVVYWVNVPNVSHTTDTVFYACMGNQYTITDQSNKAGTWNSSFGAVYHLDESGAPYHDSTANGKVSHYPSPNGFYPVAAPGFIVGAQSFNISGAQQGVGFDEILSGGGPATVEGWIKPVSGQLGMLWDGRGYNGVGLALYVNGSDGKPYLQFNPPNAAIAGTSSIADGKWHHLTGVYDGSTAYLYVDGARVASGAVSGVSYGGAWSYVGLTYNFTYGQSTADEIRVSTTALSADWIATDFNAQSSPTTFYTVSFAAIPPLPYKVKGSPILW